MSYESKLIIVNRKALPGFVYGEQLMTLDLSNMGRERVNRCRFCEIFTNPIDFDLSIQNDDGITVYSDDYWRQDYYGDHCCYTDVQDVIDWLEASETAKNNRRAALALECLKAVKAASGAFEEIVVVHYGY